MESRRNTHIYRLLTFALYFGDALFTPFFSLYFASCAGLGELEKSILLASVPFAFFIGNLFYSFFETSWKRNVFLIRIISVIEAIFLGCFGLTQNFWWLLPITILTAMHNSCFFGLIDGMGANSAKRHNIPFSTIRIMGSLAYVCGSLFGYFFLDKIGYTIFFNIGALFILAMLPISFFLVRPDEERRGQVVPEQRINNKEFFANKNVWLLLAFSALFYGALNNFNYILPIFMTSGGGGLTDGETAIWTVVRVVVEMAIMLSLPLFQKVIKTQKRILVLSCAIQLAAVLSSALISDFTALLWVVFILRGVGYGFGLVSLVLFTQEIVGIKACSKACSLATGATYVFCGIINLVSSFIYNAIGFINYFYILAAMLLAGIIILLFTHAYKKKAEDDKSPANLEQNR
ncbi:MAG: MFS transporter [Bacilli bacterium]|nr:MFS transporter [Bacilli bacterium]